MTRCGAQCQPKQRQGGFKDARAPEKVPMRESKLTVGRTYDESVLENICKYVFICKYENVQICVYLNIRDISSDPKENAGAVVIFNAHEIWGCCYDVIDCSVLPTTCYQ